MTEAELNKLVDAKLAALDRSVAAELESIRAAIVDMTERQKDYHERILALFNELADALHIGRLH